MTPDDGGAAARRIAQTAEGRRLEEARRGAPWRRWGAYLSERQWGTVREDYSADGSAWDYFPHEHARSRAYRWGEDGIGGFGEEHLYLCLGVALWNEQDAILKERLFGLTNSEGNHGEDVKELYYYLDGTPTHSYMRMLYKYPHAAFPYHALVEENRRRGVNEPEFELIDTGIFDGERYFDIEIEYAKRGIDDILMQLTAHNRGPDAAPLHLLPQLWARNTWSWLPGAPKPRLLADGNRAVGIEHPKLMPMRLVVDGAPELLFCDNETNAHRLYGFDRAGFPKDAISDFVIAGDKAAVNPASTGTKAAAHYRFHVPAGAQVRVRARLSLDGGGFGDFTAIIEQRRAEADEFHAAQARIDDAEARRVHRQACAGMLWSKQYYHYDIRQWLRGDPNQPAPPACRHGGRNADWRHLVNSDVISMPDKWEYPWYAAWDLAFHCVALAPIDPDFAKDQLILLTREWYMHPNAQLPAFEWEFGDVNPPVHAWAAWRVYEIDREIRGGEGDRAFLERVFHKLMLNFTWWVNRKDAEGRNIFQGGFLGLDNIRIFDSSEALPTGGHINQADATAWMAMYTLNLMRVALELAPTDHVYEDIATKFLEHFLLIAEAMTRLGDSRFGLWDEVDEFYYDVLQLPGGAGSVPLRVRSIVGLIPLFAVEVLDSRVLARLPEFSKRLHWIFDNRPELARLVSHWLDESEEERHLLSLLRGHRVKCLLRRMLDESEFLSEFGVRSMSKYHEREPYEFDCAGRQFSVGYVPGDSDSRIFGGNSNWRGPIWMPLNYLIIESLHRFHSYYGDEFRVECPVGSGRMLSLAEVADEITDRLCRLFLPDRDGIRPVFGADRRFSGAAFRDHLLFHEYFHGDSGRGLGAAHQTGWTGLIAPLLQSRAARRTAAGDNAAGLVRDRVAAAG